MKFKIIILFTIICNLTFAGTTTSVSSISMNTFQTYYSLPNNLTNNSIVNNFINPSSSTCEFRLKILLKSGSYPLASDLPPQYVPASSMSTAVYANGAVSEFDFNLTSVYSALNPSIYNTYGFSNYNLLRLRFIKSLNGDVSISVNPLMINNSMNIMNGINIFDQSRIPNNGSSIYTIERRCL